jgi:hypothetical protein
MSQKGTIMSMSKDRVEFTLLSNSREMAATLKAARRAFGTDFHFKQLEEGIRIRCRPSQFGRFIIYRVEEGVTCNQVRTLNPKIIPAPDDVVADVSKNRHEA